VSDEGGHEIYTTTESLRDVAKALEAKFGESRKAALVWKPQNTVAVNDEQGEKVLRLMETLNEHDDVQNVYANFEVSDALMQKLRRVIFDRFFYAPAASTFTRRVGDCLCSGHRCRCWGNDLSQQA